MQVDKKPKLNILQKLNDLDVNSDFKGHFIHDGYREMYRILFQDIQKIKQYLSNIDAIAQNIINSIFQNNIQNVQSMKSIALNIEKELEYYVDPKDIHDMYEHKASETNVTEAVKDIINTINMILETEVNMENIQHIRTAVEGINNAFTDQEERIKNDALEIIGKLIQKVTSERETPNDIENNIITLFEEFIKNRFEHINHTFFKKQIRDQKTERFLRRLFGGHFDLIKNGFTEDNTNKLTSLLESMTVSRTDKIIEKLREFAYDDTEYKDNKVTKAFSEEVSASNINTLVDKLTSEILSKSPEEIREDVYSDKIKESLTYIFEVIDPRFWTKITDDDILYIADEISSKINRMCNENKKSNDTIPIRLLKTHFKEKCIEAFGSKLENEGISSEHIFMISRRAEYALENVLKNVATEVTMPILSTTTLTVEIEFKDHTETLGIYEYIVLPIANTAIKTINDIKKRHESSAKKIDEKVDIAIIENAEENITTQLLKLLEINKIIEENANVVIVEQIITPIARAIILTDIDVYVKEVVKTNAQEIMELIRTLVSEMILNNYFQFVLYDCQKEYAILREACELLLTNTSDEHRELFNKIKHLDSIKGNIIFSIDAEFAIYRVQYIVIMMFKKFTEENTDIYDIILTMCENFTDVFNRNYFIFLIEKTKILEEVIKDSELKCITIYYMLYYAYRKISPDNTLALYVLNFEMHKLRFLYDMNEFLLRIDPVMYSRVYNMLFAYYHFQNNSAKLTNNIYDLNNNDKKVIHAIMYIINRMKYPILIPTIRAHNDIYASLNNVFSVCDDAVDNNVMNIDNDFYIFNNSFNSSLSRIATYTCYYVIFIEVYDIFTDDTRVTFLERINNINIINTHTSLNEYENIETRIQERLLRYKLLRMIDVDLLSKLLNKVNDTIQHFVQNEYITKLINNILAFVEDNVTRIPDDIVEVELNIDEYVVDVIKDIVSYLRTIPIYKYIQKATSISPSVRHIIDLFNIIYESVLTSDHITYDIINEFIQTLDYFNIGKEVNIDFLPYNPNLVLKYLSNIMDSPEYRILIIYFNNTQSIIDNITTNRTEVDSIMEEISTNFHDKVLHALRVPFDYNTDYNVLREMFGITKRIKDEIDIEDIYTESYLTTMRNIFRVDLFNKDHDELHNDMKGGNIVYDTTYFIKNELPDTRRNDDLYGGMYTPAHMMLPLDIKFNTCKLRILAKVTPKITSALKKACYVDELEGVQADIPEDAQEYVLKDVLRSTLKDVPRSTLKDVLECVPEDVLRSTLKDVLEGVQADIPEDAQEYVPKDVLRSTLKDVLEGVPEDVLESVLEGVPEDVPNVVLEGVPKVVLESVLEGVLNGTLVGVPEDVPEDVPEGTSSVLSVVNKTEYFNKAIRLFYPLIDMITYYIKCAMYIGFKQEFTDIEKLPLLYKYMYEYFQTAIRCAICQKDINTTVYILPLSNYNPSKVMFYDDFDHLPYVDILRPIFDKLNATNRHEIYTRLLYDVTKAECYTIFNERIAVPFFAALVYHATVIHYLNLPITILRKILNLDEKTNNVQIALIHEYLSPVFENLVMLVNNSKIYTEEATYGNKKSTLPNKRKQFTDEELTYMVNLLQDLYTNDFTARNLLDAIPFFIPYFMDENRNLLVDAKRLLGVANLVCESEYHYYDKLRSRYKLARDLENEYSDKIHNNMEKINTQVLMFERKIANSIIGLIYKHLAFIMYNSLTDDAKININDTIIAYLVTLKDAVIYSRCYDIRKLNSKLESLKSLINDFESILPTKYDILKSFKEIFITYFDMNSDKECYRILANKLEDIITSAIRTYYFKINDYKTKMKNESVSLNPYPDKNYSVAKTYTINNYPKTITGFASLIQAYEGLISPFISFLVYILSNSLGNSMLTSNPSPKNYSMDKVDRFIYSMENAKKPEFTGGLAYDGEFHDYSALTKYKNFSHEKSTKLKHHFQIPTHARYELLVNKSLCSYDTNILTDELLDTIIKILIQINFTKSSVNKKEYYTKNCIENIKAILGKHNMNFADISQKHVESLEKLKTFLFNIVLPSMNLCVHNGEIVPVNVRYVEINRRTFEQVVVCIDRNKAAAVTESNFKVELLRRLIMHVYTIGRTQSHNMIPESVVIIFSYKHLNATVGRNLQLDYVRKHYAEFHRLLVFIIDDDDVLDPLTSFYVLSEAIELNYTTNVIISNQDTSKLNLYVDGYFVTRYSVWSILWSPFMYTVSIRCMPMNKEDQALHATIVAYNVNAVTSDVCEAAGSGIIEVMYKYNSPISRQSDSRYDKDSEFENPYAIKYTNAVIENDQGFDKIIVPASTHTSASARMYAYTIGKFVLNDNRKKIPNQNLYGLPLLTSDRRMIVNNELVRLLDRYDDFENDEYTRNFNAKHTARHTNRENLDGDGYIVFYVASQRCLLYDGNDYQIVDKRGNFVACQDGKLTSIEKLRELIAGDIDEYYKHEIENDFTRSLMKCDRNELHEYVEMLINEMLNPDFCLWDTNMKIFYEYIANWLNYINNARHITEDNVNIFVPDKVRGGNANVLDFVIKILLIIAIVLLFVVMISIIVKYIQKQSKIKQIMHRHNLINHKH